MNILKNFFRKQDSGLADEIKRIGLRNDARFKAVKEKMMRDGVHLLCGAKYVPADEFKAQRRVL